MSQASRVLAPRARPARRWLAPVRQAWTDRRPAQSCPWQRRFSPIRQAAPPAQHPRDGNRRDLPRAGGAARQPLRPIRSRCLDLSSGRWPPDWRPRSELVRLHGTGGLGATLAVAVCGAGVFTFATIGGKTSGRRRPIGDGGASRAGLTSAVAHWFWRMVRRLLAAPAPARALIATAPIAGWLVAVVVAVGRFASRHD